jgi:hypothetical protein
MSTHAGGATMARQRGAVATKTKPMSVTQRNTLATQQLLSSVGGTDKTVALTAALEVINEWLATDRGVQQRLREKVDELAALTKGKQKADLGPAPTPLPGHTLTTPHGHLDPYALLYTFGPDQLRAAVVRAPRSLLQEGVRIVKAREPGTKPQGQTNPDLVDYIVQHVAGPSY